jgi:pilus assembly protein Flp/PilA
MLHGLYKWMVARQTDLQLKSERGATAVEYGLMVALIAAVIVATVVVLGEQIDAAFVKVKDAIVGANS